MSKCDYIKCTLFSEIIHHIIISKYTLECTQLNYLLKIFLEEHTLEYPLSIKLNSNNARGMYYTTTGAKQRGVGGLATPLNFGRGGSTPTDFEIIFFLISQIGPFLIA